MITPHTPKLLLKNLSFYFTKYKNDWKQRKFWKQKIKKSNQDR